MPILPLLVEIAGETESPELEAPHSECHFRALSFFLTFLSSFFLTFDEDFWRRRESRSLYGNIFMRFSGIFVFFFGRKYEIEGLVT